jgi:hypothetical protein
MDSDHENQNVGVHSSERIHAVRSFVGAPGQGVVAHDVFHHPERVVWRFLRLLATFSTYYLNPYPDRQSRIAGS